MSTKSLMMSLLRKIKGYGDEPDLSQKYVVKQWESIIHYYEYPKYHYTVYRVLENKSLEVVLDDFSFRKDIRKVNIKQRLKRLRDQDKFKNQVPRWYP